MKTIKNFRIPITTLLAFYCFCVNGQEVNYKSADFGLKNNPKSISRVNYDNVPPEKRTTLFQLFNKNGDLIKHFYLFNRFSTNRDTLIYNSDNSLAKIITTIDRYNYKEESIYKYIDDANVEITTFNNSSQNGRKGKKMKKSGIYINSYNGSKLTKRQAFAFEKDYKKNKPSSEELYTYDDEHKLIEKTTLSNKERKTVFTYSNDGHLSEKSYYVDGEISDIIYYKNYEFDDMGNWIKRSVESKNNPADSYTISRVISYHTTK